MRKENRDKHQLTEEPAAWEAVSHPSLLYPNMTLGPVNSSYRNSSNKEAVKKKIRGKKNKTMAVTKGKTREKNSIKGVSYQAKQNSTSEGAKKAKKKNSKVKSKIKNNSTKLVTSKDKLSKKVSKKQTKNTTKKSKKQKTVSNKGKNNNNTKSVSGKIKKTLTKTPHSVQECNSCADC